MDNKIEFKVYGKYALFTDPLTKIGGEKNSYQLPTYQALKGIMESIYWKPTIIWIIDKVRIMKPIRTQTRSAKPLKYGESGHDLSIYTYLADVEYQVQAHFKWNLSRQDLANDRNENKHFFVAQRMVKKGGRRDVFLGTRECQGYVEPIRFGTEIGCYDQSGDLSFGLTLHGFDYPSEINKDELRVRFWRPTMSNGVVQFIPPEKCLITKLVRKMTSNRVDTVGLEEENLLDGYKLE